MTLLAWVALISLASAVHDLGRTLCPSREELASRFVKFDAAQCERCRRLASEHARHVLRAASPAAAAVLSPCANAGDTRVMPFFRVPCLSWSPPPSKLSACRMMGVVVKCCTTDIAAPPSIPATMAV